MSHPPRNGEATLLYRSRPGLPPTGSSDVGMLITAFQADIEPAFFGKVVDPGTRVETVTVQGRTGYWIEGAPHEFFYRYPWAGQNFVRYARAVHRALKRGAKRAVSLAYAA